MSTHLRRLTSREVLRALGTFGFHLDTTRGSHGKLRRITAAGEHQILTIPLHRTIAPGTLHAIYRQACRFIPSEKLRPFFFTE